MAAIGITNQRETLVAFDRSTGRPLHNAIVWQDRRTAALCAELTEAGHLPLVRATTGLVLDPYFSATKAAWLLRHGDLALAPDDPNLSFCTVDSWVLWNLTGGARGGTYATDPSNASRTLLLDTATLSWSPELCDLFGVPPHTLPEVRPSAGRFGTAVAGRPRLRVRRARRRARRGRARRPAGRALRAGLLRAGHGEGHLRHRQLRPGQRGGGPPAGAGRAHGQLRLGPRRPCRRRAGPRGLRARGIGLRVGRGHPVAARRARHHLHRRRGRPPRRPRCPTAVASPSSRR